MKVPVEITSPPLQLRCKVCGKTSIAFRRVGEVEVEKHEIPFGILDNILFSDSEGRYFKKNEVNIVPSICPDCQELGFTLGQFGIKVIDWVNLT